MRGGCNCLLVVSLVSTTVWHLSVKSPLHYSIIFPLLIPLLLRAEPSTLQVLPSVGHSQFAPEANDVAALLAKPQTDFYGIYSIANHVKLGWMSARWDLGTEDGTRCIRQTEVTHYTFLHEKATTHQVCHQKLVFSAKAPHELLQASRDETIHGNTLKTQLTRIRPGEYRAVITEAGESRSKTLTNLHFTATDRLGFQFWATADGRRRGDCQGFRGFDLKSLEPREERNCVLLELTSAQLATVERNDLSARFTNQYVLDAAGRIQMMTIGSANRLVLENESDAKMSFTPPDLIAASLIKSQRPLGPIEKLPPCLQFVLSGPSLRQISSTSCQRVELNATATEAAIRTGRGVHPAIPATNDEIKQNLRATLQLPCDDARIVKLAREAIGPATTEAVKVRRLLNFVSKFIVDDLRVKPQGVISILKHPRGDCTAHALFFTALARAAGIPCREASGYVYLGDLQQCFGGHAWNEVVIDGHWHPVDPTYNEFTLNPTHIQISTGPPSPQDAQFFCGQFLLRVK